VHQADLDSVLLRGDPSCPLVRPDDMRLEMIDIDKIAATETNHCAGRYQSSRQSKPGSCSGH
jgi:hypothetical protein